MFAPLIWAPGAHPFCRCWLTVTKVEGQGGAPTTPTAAPNTVSVSYEANPADSVILYSLVPGQNLFHLPGSTEHRRAPRDRGLA
jgi:hypothetical protein